MKQVLDVKLMTTYVILVLSILSYPGETSNIQNPVVSGFGRAQHFMPLPYTVVGAHCTWKIRLNTYIGRVPGESLLNTAA